VTGGGTVSSPERLHDDSPFHRGEREVQTRVGVRDKIQSIGERVIRDFMPEQHREFFGQLPFIIIGTVDAAGSPWASMLTGTPGFISSPDPRSLRIDARLLPGDPLAHTLNAGVDVGLLGIDLHTRRRNRVNGPIVNKDARDFTLQVAQSFGNCPKYINKRRYELIAHEHRTTLAPRVLEQLDSATAGQIQNADTFFIATHSTETCPRRSHGADVSHRGGKPGFVHIDDERILTWPDYVGNFLFNTLGNLMLNPRAGLLFPDFATGDMLYLSGRGEVIWDGDEVRAFAGAQRLVRFHIERLVQLSAALPMRWRFEEYSPFLEPASRDGAGISAGA
jgi:hypothetical protein